MIEKFACFQQFKVNLEPMRRRVKRTKAKQVHHIDRSGLDEVELAKLQAFEDLNRGFRGAIRLIVPTMIFIVFAGTFYLWIKNL